ncbi:ABC-type multidrug transport system, ATPase component [Marininema mesophilum]|uniref:ABC-type multidrug transport system, ATPase component n=1 Tax=Marininema mesophilum TaxID=1048340 RepID=A0A1H2WJH8_9BACL|nr:ABC-type multidrug transport system, ATPase component [Marininema mesophilum]
MNVLEAKNVTKRVGSRTLIDQMSFSIKKGQICGFLGPNGAGKTTLIRLLTGLIHPTKGDLSINGISVTQNRTKALMNIGAIVESPIFFPYLTGRKALLNLARLHPQLKGAQRKSRVKEVLEKVGLSHAADQKVGTYSLGMKQRLGIAQALLGNPSVIILDEPANGLDPMGMRELRSLILKLREETGISFFISSHLLDELQQLCDHLVVIKNGKLVWQGEMESLSGKPLYAFTLTPIDKAAPFIKKHYPVDHIEGNQIYVEIHEEDLAILNTHLIENGIQILSVEKKQKRLEDAFVEMMSS